jgi:hypothetical protein
MRRKVAEEMAEVKRGLRHPKDVTPLPVGLRWARAQDVAGKPDSSKQFGHGRKGYRIANGNSKEKGGDVGNAWLKELPPGCTLGADGSIRNGDTVLMVCSREDAAKSEFAKRRETEARVKGAEGAFASMVASSRDVSRGVDAYTKSTPVTPAKK